MTRLMDFLRRSALTILTLTLLFTISQCSVKEDRSLCPCRLFFDYSALLSDERIAGEGNLVTESVVSDSEGNVAGRLVCDGGTSSAELILPRGKYLTTTVIYDSQKISSEGGSLRQIPATGDFILLGESSWADASGESAFCAPLPYKQFIRLTVHFANPVSDLQVSLSIPSGAVSAATLEGENSACRISRTVSSDKVTFHILRQLSNDISLSFGSALKSGEIAEIRLYDALTKSGFDPEAKNLNDIDIYADIHSLTISLCVNGWQSETINMIF